MNERIRWLALSAVLIMATACSRPAGESEGATGSASAKTTVDRALSVAHAIQANPTASDSILAAHGLTRLGFDSLLYDISADSAMAWAYSDAVR